MQDHYITVAVPGPFQEPLHYRYDPSVYTIPTGSRVEVPLGNRKVIGVACGSTNSIDIASDKIKSITKLLDDEPVLADDIFSLCTWAATYYHQYLGDFLSSALPKLLRDGLPPTKKTEPHWQLTTLGKGLGEASLKRAPAQQKCINLIRTHSIVSQTLLKQHNVKTPAIKALLEKQLIEKTVQEPPPPTERPKTTLGVTLNDQQTNAVNQIIASPGNHLLFGITGSGKTEVYLELIRRQLEQSKQALIILPEINLTPQFVKRFETRLGLKVDALHSNMTDRQRLNVWLDAKSGRSKIIIGTRSALFTPFQSLGLIVVDEEHSQTLKQQEGLRYSARDLAIWRANHLKISCVLGSATPSLESYYNATTHRYQLSLLTQRTKNAQPPSWETVDIRRQALHAGLSEHVLTAASHRLYRGEHVLFFINRLGYAPNILCQNCGWHAECNTCDSNLRVFLQKRQLCCAHCDTRQPLPRSCPQCGHTQLHTTGQGTEQLEEYLQSYFDYPVIRIDSETSGSKSKLEANLQLVENHDAAIIIGTQMMTKGHDFERLNLVVVVNADEGLASGDFRAIESTAQLLTQVAGRAGRHGQSGKVMIQTYTPEHPLFQTLASNDYERFLSEETRQRNRLELPPFSYEALILVTCKSPSAAQDHLANLVNSYQWDCITLGPQPAILARKAGWFRATLTLRANSRRNLHYHIALAKRWLEANKNYRIRWSIDVDPVSTV